LRVLWINPVGTSTFDDALSEELEPVKRPETEVEVRSLAEGPTHLEYHAYEAEVVPGMLRMIASAERDGFDAVAIGCFCDTGLRPAREIAQRIAVAAPCESCLHVAATLGNTFSILGVTRKTIPEMHDNVVRYGFRDRLASFRVLGMGIDDFHVDPELTCSRLIADGRAAVDEDRAEVLVLGCTIQYGFHTTLQREVGVPVVDPVVATLKYAELLGELAALGWTTSKVGGYKSAPPEEVARFGLEELLPRPFAAA
jgi:allantoin racemase